MVKTVCFSHFFNISGRVQKVQGKSGQFFALKKTDVPNSQTILLERRVEALAGALLNCPSPDAPESFLQTFTVKSLQWWESDDGRLHIRSELCVPTSLIKSSLSCSLTDESPIVHQRTKASDGYESPLYEPTSMEGGDSTPIVTPSTCAVHILPLPPPTPLLKRPQAVASLATTVACTPSPILLVGCSPSFLDMSETFLGGVSSHAPVFGSLMESFSSSNSSSFPSLARPIASHSLSNPQTHFFVSSSSANETAAIDEDLVPHCLFNEDLLWTFLSHAALGLGALHVRGILHLDVKPANFLLASLSTSPSCESGVSITAETAEGDIQDKKYILKLGDFGAAQPLSASPASSCLSVATPVRATTARTSLELQPTPPLRTPSCKFSSELNNLSKAPVKREAPPLVRTAGLYGASPLRSPAASSVQPLASPTSPNPLELDLLATSPGLSPNLLSLSHPVKRPGSQDFLYSSREVFERSICSGLSDVFSLGASLWHWITTFKPPRSLWAEWRRDTACNKFDRKYVHASALEHLSHTSGTDNIAQKDKQMRVETRLRIMVDQTMVHIDNLSADLKALVSRMLDDDLTCRVSLADILTSKRVKELVIDLIPFVTTGTASDVSTALYAEIVSRLREGSVSRLPNLSVDDAIRTGELPKNCGASSPMPSAERPGTANSSISHANAKYSMLHHADGLPSVSSLSGIFLKSPEVPSANLKKAGILKRQDSDFNIANSTTFTKNHSIISSNRRRLASPRHPLFAAVSSSGSRQNVMEEDHNADVAHPSLRTFGSQILFADEEDEETPVLIGSNNNEDEDCLPFANQRAQMFARGQMVRRLMRQDSGLSACWASGSTCGEDSLSRLSWAGDSGFGAVRQRLSFSHIEEQQIPSHQPQIKSTETANDPHVENKNGGEYSNQTSPFSSSFQEKAISASASVAANLGRRAPQPAAPPLRTLSSLMMPTPRAPYFRTLTPTQQLIAKLRATNSTNGPTPPASTRSITSDLPSPSNALSSPAPSSSTVVTGVHFSQVNFISRARSRTIVAGSQENGHTSFLSSTPSLNGSKFPVAVSRLHVGKSASLSPNTLLQVDCAPVKRPFPTVNFPPQDAAAINDNSGPTTSSFAGKSSVVKTILSQNHQSVDYRRLKRRKLIICGEKGESDDKISALQGNATN